MLFKGLAYGLPSKLVTNEMMVEKVLARSAKTFKGRRISMLERALYAMFDQLGTKERYHRDVGETAFEHTKAAALRAIQEADIDAQEVDLVIYAGVGRGLTEPASANIFIEQLGLSDATGFDIIDACASWVRAVQVGLSLGQLHGYRNVMVVTSEFNCHEVIRYTLSELADLRHSFPGFTIGESATAVVFDPQTGPDPRFSFRNWGQMSLCMIPLVGLDSYTGGGHGLPEDWRGHKFYSFGGALLKYTADKMIEHYESDPTLAVENYAHIFGHSASDDICMKVCSQIGLDETKYFPVHEKYGNNVSSSIPLGMALAREGQVLCEGDGVVLGVGSAGVVTSWIDFEFRSV